MTTYELWQFDNDDVYAIRLEPCEAYEVSDVPENTVFTDKITGYVRFFKLFEWPDSYEALESLSYTFQPAFPGYDFLARELEMMRVNGRCLIRKPPNPSA